MAEPIRQLRTVADAASALRKAFDEQGAFNLESFRQERARNQPEKVLSQMLDKTSEMQRATERCLAALWAALDSLAAADGDRLTQA